MLAYSVLDADASYSFELPIKPRTEPCFKLTCLCDLPLFLLLHTRAFQRFYIFSKMTKDGHDSDGLGETHPAFWASHLSASDERRIRKSATFRVSSNSVLMRIILVLWLGQMCTKSASTSTCSRQVYDFRSSRFLESYLAFLTCHPTSCRRTHGEPLSRA
jgi:hypothetical protein